MKSGNNRKSNALISHVILTRERIDLIYIIIQTKNTYAYLNGREYYKINSVYNNKKLCDIYKYMCVCVIV